MISSKRIALVTGGNRGLGFETCRQLAQQEFHVILTSRNHYKGKEKVQVLQKEGLDVSYWHLDVTNFDSIAATYEEVVDRWGRLDILINNAGIYLEEVEGKGDIYLKHANDLRVTMETNVLGPYQLCDRFCELMRKNNYGRIVNVSSEMAQLKDMGADHPAYRISKTALNAVTCVFAARLAGSNVLVNSVNPGWVQTEMGGPHASRSLNDGVKGVLWAALLPDGGPTGRFFQDGEEFPW